MRFGFFAFTPFSFNLAREFLFAAGLASRGDKAIVVACDGAPRCMVQIGDPPGTDRASRCAGCLSGTQSLYRQTFQDLVPRVEGVSISQVIDRPKQQAAWAAVDALPDGALFDFELDGLPLGAWVVDNLRMEYLGERWQLLPDWPAKAREWLKAGINAALATAGFIAVVQPDAVVVINGIPVSERSVWAMAQKLGVRAITYEEGQRPHTLVLTESAPAARYTFAPEWQAWRDTALSVAENRRIDAYLYRRWYQASVDEYVYSPSSTDDPTVLHRDLALTPGRPLLVAFTNVLADTSILGAEQAFDSLLDWATAMIRYAEDHPAIDLVIRVHPAELAMTTKREGEAATTRDPFVPTIREGWPDLPANVRLVAPEDPVSSYDLLRLADVALVYVTSVGMEAAAMGIPVVSAGRSHYADVGFTWHVRQRSEFAPLLDRLLSEPRLPPRGQELARRYVGFWYFRTCLELPALRRLDVTRLHPDGMRGMLQSFGDIDLLMDDPHPVSVHLFRYLRGEVPYLPPPAPWRQADTRVPSAPSLLLLPDGVADAAFVARIVAVLATLPEAPPCVWLAQPGRPLPDNMPATWAVLPLAHDETPLGEQLLQACALVMGPDLDDPAVLDVAQHVMVPCFGADDEDLATEIAALVAASPLAGRLRQPAGS